MPFMRPLHLRGARQRYSSFDGKHHSWQEKTHVHTPRCSSLSLSLSPSATYGESRCSSLLPTGNPGAPLFHLRGITVALYPHQSTAHARGYVIHILSGKHTARTHARRNRAQVVLSVVADAQSSSYARVRCLENGSPARGAARLDSPLVLLSLLAADTQSRSI